MIKFKTIDIKEIRQKTLLNYLEENYTALSKEQIYKLTTEYIRAIYLRNGHLHVIATNEALKYIEEDNKKNE